MLWVCATASSTDGASRTCELRDALGTTATSDDERHRVLLLRATAWAEGELGRPLLAQVYSESVAAYGGRRLALSRYPLRAVLRMFDSTATCDATEFTSTDYVVEDAEAGLLARDAGWSWTNRGAAAETCFSLGLTKSYLPGREERPWLVEYVAGYVFPEAATCSEVWTTAGGTTSTARSLPHDLEQAVLLKAQRWVGGGQDVTSRRVGDLGVTYAGPGEREEEHLLERYRSAV